MSLLEAIILGLIQGLTEFLPVSSSGHLVLMHHFFGVTDTGLAFDVALHFGTMVALIIYFRRDLVKYAISFFKKTPETRLSWLLVFATIPAAISGFLLESAAESTFRSPKLVAFTILLFGALMLLAERYYKSRKSHTVLDKIENRQGIGMGFAQALAIVPGVSRSGSTITAGLLLSMDRVAATRFSFLLGIPIMSGAVLKVFTEDDVWQQVAQQSDIFIVGVLTALVSGLFAIRFMLRFLAGHSLNIFAYYRIFLGLLLIAVFAF